MERYEAYKDSGIEWIGEIPEDWIYARLKQHNSIAGRIGWQGLTSDEYCDEGPYLITGINFVNGMIDWNSCVRISNERWAEATQIQISDGDLLITKDGTVGKIAFAADLQGRASLNSGVMVIRPITFQQSMRYLYWVLQSEVFWGWFSDINAGNSTIIHLYQRDFLNFAFFLPPMAEQTTIADYLDAKTSEIDALVADYEREIGLLREYRKAVISEAVTKGLDPDAPMKDSGIEWIGDIPEGWVCAKLGLISTSTLGRMLDSEKQSGDCLAPYLSNRDVQWFYVDDADLKEMDFPYALRESYEIRDGDMLVCEGGEVGRSAVWHGPTPEFYFQKAVHRVRFDSRVVNSDFAAYQMFQKAQVSGFREVRKGESTIGHLPGDQLRQLTFIIPPIEEQHTIVACLDAKTAEIDSLIDAKQEMVDKLREYRRSLISEVVTGKFKVPGV